MMQGTWNFYAPVSEYKTLYDKHMKKQEKFFEPNRPGDKILRKKHLLCWLSLNSPETEKILNKKSIPVELQFPKPPKLRFARGNTILKQSKLRTAKSTFKSLKKKMFGKSTLIKL